MHISAQWNVVTALEFVLDFMASLCLFHALHCDAHEVESLVSAPNPLLHSPIDVSRLGCGHSLPHKWMFTAELHRSARPVLPSSA